MLVDSTMPCRSSEVPWGVRVPALTSLMAEADGVRRCLARYEADRGRLGRLPDVNDERRLASGDPDAEEAGERWEGGV